jgi:hypothetical protein
MLGPDSGCSVLLALIIQERMTCICAGRRQQLVGREEREEKRREERGARKERCSVGHDDFVLKGWRLQEQHPHPQALPGRAGSHGLLRALTGSCVPTQLDLASAVHRACISDIG